MCQSYPPGPGECVEYHRDLMPIFADMMACLERLDAFEIRLIVGDRMVDLLEDRLIRLIYKSYQETHESAKL